MAGHRTWLEAEATADRPILLSVIIPTFNEKENIDLLLCLLHKYLRDVAVPAPPAGMTQPGAAWWWEAIIVDDASPDGTAGFVKQLIKQDSAHLGQNLRLVERPGKLGLGTAYRAGLEQARGAWVVLMDADLSHHPKYLPSFLQKQIDTKCDIVSGTRYLDGGGVSGWNWKRKMFSRGANLLAQSILSAGQSDLTGAYRLYRRECLDELLKRTTCRGYAFQMEVAVRAQYCGHHVEEVPIVFVDRLYGLSKLGPNEFLGFLKGLARLLFVL